MARAGTYVVQLNQSYNVQLDDYVPGHQGEAHMGETKVISYVCLISLWPLDCLQTYMFYLTLLFFEGASISAFIFGVSLLRTWVSATIIGYVSLISFWLLVCLKTVIDLLISLDFLSEFCIFRTCLVVRDYALRSARRSLAM